MLRLALDASSPTPRLPLELEPGLPEPVRRKRLPRARRRLVALVMLAVLAVGGVAAGARRLGEGTATPLVAPATATGAQLRLMYAGAVFAVYNASGRALNVDGLSFARSDQSGLFEAAQFGERVSLAFPRGQCLQIFAGSTDRRAAPPECGPQIAPQVVYTLEEQFWTPRDDRDPEVFLVQLRGQTVQTCSTRLTTCDVKLP
jgi:hypothetical protein